MKADSSNDMASAFIPVFRNAQVVFLLWSQNGTLIDSTSYRLTAMGSDAVQVDIPPDAVDDVFFQLTALAELYETNFILYDSKDMFSSIRRHLTRNGWKPDATLPNSLFDLRYFELYSGIDLPPPQNLSEAKSRLKRVYKHGEQMHRRIQLPLATTVLPSIECQPVVQDGQAKYSRYVIEGTGTGRLSCNRPNEHFFMPHSMGEAARQSTRPAGNDAEFMVFDYTGLEVQVLLSVSKDDKLRAAIGDGDPYTGIYREVFGGEMKPEARQMVKRTFLPVMYGMMPAGLSRELDCSPRMAERLHRTYHQAFPVASEYLAAAEETARRTQSATDALGRIRRYEEDPHKARGAAVQGPGAAECLEKLIRLCSGIGELGRVVMSVHDGFVIAGSKKNRADIARRGRELLTSPSDWLPGLKLAVKIKVGPTLGHLEDHVED